MATIASRVSGKTILPMELDEEAFQATKYTGNPLDEELWKSKLFAVQVCNLDYFGLFFGVFAYW
jgi:hypothetical protein